MNFKDIILLPNLITLFRFFSSIALFFYFAPNSFNTFSLVIIIALIGLSDSLDGIVARKYNLVSKLGIVLDPLTDRVVFIILLFWYPSYEILFSIIRKNVMNKSPMTPDTNHLHHQIFYMIKKIYSWNNMPSCSTSNY